MNVASKAHPLKTRLRRKCDLVQHRQSLYNDLLRPSPVYILSWSALTALRLEHFRFWLLFRCVFFTRTGIHPRVKPETMLRSKRCGVYRSNHHGGWRAPHWPEQEGGAAKRARSTKTSGPPLFSRRRGWLPRIEVSMVCGPSCTISGDTLWRS